MDGPGKILVVGASGFVGRAVTGLMAERALAGVAVSRRPLAAAAGPVRHVTVQRYEDRAAVAEAAQGCGAAIMLAGRAHVLKESEPDPAGAFLHANCRVPLAVAEAFAEAGGRRFVLLSSISVNGLPGPGRALREEDEPAPANDYGRSKLAGEQALERFSRESGIELAIVRSPLVYGPGAPGNFGQLLSAAKRGLPLPLAAIRNRRDMIGSVNLADLLLLCAHHPAAAGALFMASDGEALSTAELARILYREAGREGRLLPVPPALLRIAARALGKGELASRLLDDLRVDSGRARRLLGWRPPLAAREGVRRSVGEGQR
jgi:nucleoside-diphosphate-sugar epimerase